MEYFLTYIKTGYYKTNMTLKNLMKVLLGKTVLAAVLPLLCLSAAVPALAQTAEIRSAGVYYLDATAAGTPNINDVYCNWDASTLTGAGNAAYKGGIVNVAGHSTNDPWDTSALIEYDQPYPAPTAANKYPNHCLSLCLDVYCTNKPSGQSTYSIAFPIQNIRFEIAKYYGSKDITNPDTNPAVRTIYKSILNNDIIDSSQAAAALTAFNTALANANTARNTCNSVTYIITSGGGTTAYNGCAKNVDECYLGKDVCQANVSCESNPSCLNALNALSRAANAYKQAAAAIESAGTKIEDFMCGSYHCYGANPKFEDTTVCPSPSYFCEGDRSDSVCYDMGGAKAGTVGNICCDRTHQGNTGNNCTSTNCVIFDGNGAQSQEPIRFCTPWDGSYEISGEFGKTNGQFGFRANIKTDFPGDGNAIESITIDDTKTYPLSGQYPIQVDVTNVHTVRSTPTVVGSITSVQATPYTIAYRLSKDADVRIQIFDASAQIPYTGDSGNTGGDQGITQNSDTNLVLEQNSVVRHLVDWQPRLGEGMKGADSDKLIVESDSWDGRDDDGRLLPANNYLVSVQAKSQDEWPGTDFSRAVTRQLSLDPLKLTDIEVEGLNKRSTAYATIRYVPTEASNVYFEVYSPGTTFDDSKLFTKGYEQTGKAPAPTNGTLVYRSQQQRGRGMSYPDKWDGLCHNEAGCEIPYPKGTKLPISGETFDGTQCTADNGTVTDGNCVITYANGAPLPDGDYIYLLWAEIPYNDVYYNGAACYPNPAGCDTPRTDDVTTARNGTFTGVKTQKYYTGIVPVERGVVDITIQPVSYSTIGSSPTAYGLDPFIFKYSIAREATVEAEVQNTAGVTVKTLTDEGGNTNVAQQMNTLSWDGRDDQGRMVGPGTYMFVVKTKDPMFPQSVQTTASALFPVDLYRVVDLSTTDVYGDSEAKATINYTLSKAMAVQLNIYNKDVVIPAQNGTGAPVEAVEDNIPAAVAAYTEKLPGLTAGLPVPASVSQAAYVRGDFIGTQIVYTEPVYDAQNTKYTYYAVTKNVTAFYDANHVLNNNLNFPTYEDYTVTSVVRYEVTAAPWPPRVCDKESDATVFNTNGSVNPAMNPQCIYVNDLSFTNYPATPAQAKYNYAEGAAQTLDVRLQPVKTFNRSATQAGEGVRLTEEWDAQYFYNPTPVSTADGGKNTPAAVAACMNQTDLKQCPYEMVPDGQYPFYVAAQTNEAVDLYYDKTTAQPFRAADDVLQQTGLYATDKPVYRINVTRGPVYFLDGSVAVYPNAPQLFNTSSGPVFVPPYEINFAISRAATVEVAVVALEDGLCTTANTNSPTYDNKAGDVCKYLSTMTIVNSPNFDPNVTRKIYWDGTDNNGKYVRNGNYEIRLTAKNYPDAGLYQPTVKQLTVNVDLLKVFDLPETEAYALNKRGTDMKISYQISVPMKVAIQIFKPGTTIYDYQKGTLRDPATGKEVTDIRDVLVRAIVGIRPSTTLIEEVWDGRDYAQQDVPDGTYPFRFVTALNSADIDTITGEVLSGSDSILSKDAKINYVADTFQYVNLHRATVAIGDGEFVCEDWEKTVFFYPNPFKAPTGTLEITKLPVPGKMSIKLYNLAGDLVREGGYQCVDANNMTVTMGTAIDLSPDNTISNDVYTGYMPTLRNAALRCFWDKTNDHGKRVARGVYFGLVDFRAQNGRQHCQKVVKILIPR